MQGHKYALLIVDECTSYTWVQFMATKAQAGDILQAFIIHQFNIGRAVGILRTDNGGEFSSSSFKHFLWGRGIQHNQSPAYTPQFQGKVERMNRSVGEKAHSMRVAAGLPSSFWELAWGCAVFLRNRSPTSANAGNMTPYEALLGRQPRLEHLRTFGCRAEAHLKGMALRKGADRSIPGLFVGYDESSMTYKFLPDGARKWVPVRTMVCQEVQAAAESKGEVVDQSTGMATMRFGSVGMGAESKDQRMDDDAQPEMDAEQKMEDLMDYEAQSKGEGRPQLVAAKSIQMITRNKLGKRLREERHELALVGVDCYGAEMFGDGGFKERVPKSVKEALEGPEKELWQDAIREELEAMEEAEVWGEPVRMEPLRPAL
jgi:hypothetical protein